MKTLQEIRTEIVQVAADLVAGQWSSSYREDLPPRTSKKVIRGLEMDADHRVRLSQRLKAIYDALSQPTDGETK